jgi:hypothetical protein
MEGCGRRIRFGAFFLSCSALLFLCTASLQQIQAQNSDPAEQNPPAAPPSSPTAEPSPAQQSPPPAAGDSNQAAPLPAAVDGSKDSVPTNLPDAGKVAPLAPVDPAIAPNAPRMSRETHYEIIRDFETQLVYARTAFPMGTKGLSLKDGATLPNGPELQQLLALSGPAIRPGDPARISFVQIKDNHIHLELNGGPIRRKKWYEHLEVGGANGAQVPISANQTTENVHGTFLDVYFDKYVPEMTPQQLRDLLMPALDFNARNKEQAYLDTLPPKVKEAIKAHYVLIGMNSEMVLHAKGKPPKKVREKDGETLYEEWIYGEPPQDVDFVRIVDDEVVRVETMKVGGEKIVRTEKEVILPRPDHDTEAKKEEDRSPSAPSLRRPGEDPENVPKPASSPLPVPPMPPPDVPQPQGPNEAIPSIASR